MTEEDRTVTASFTLDAGPDMVFAPGAFDGSRGKTVPLRVGDSDETSDAVIQDVTITADGKAEVVIKSAILNEVSLVGGEYELGLKNVETEEPDRG